MAKTISIFVSKAVGMGYKTLAVAVSAIHAHVEAETEKAIKIRPYEGKHTLWIPKKALKKVEGSVQGYDLAPWFGRTGYAAWFIDHYRRESILTA